MTETLTSESSPALNLHPALIPQPLPAERPPIKIATVTICGPGRDEAIIDALESAHWVDAHILIDTQQQHYGDGCSSSETVAAALRYLESIPGSPKPIVMPYAWTNFADVRTYELDVAKDMGFDWAIVLDSDEMLLFGPYPREGLVAMHYQLPEVSVLKCHDNCKRYMKDRAIRLYPELPDAPRPKYVGFTHEFMTYDKGHSIVQSDWLFSERGKDAAGNQHKFTRDVDLLTKQILTVLTSEELDAIAKGECDPKVVARGMQIDSQLCRWIMYMGESMRCMSMPGWEHYTLACVQCDPFEEQAAWGAYQVALRFYHARNSEENGWNLDSLHEIEGIIALGLRRYPLPELAWLMGKMASMFSQREKALAWARSATGFLSMTRIAFKEADIEWWICDLLIWTTMDPAEQKRAIEWGKKLGKTSAAPLL